MRNTKEKLLAFMTMGITPERLALCIALGITLGLVPALGTTTLLCTLTAFVFRLNLAAILLVNYFVYPLQLAMLVPFMRAGEKLFGAKPLELSVELIQSMLKTDLWGAVFGLWKATMHAVTAWILIAPILIALLYIIVMPLLKRLSPKRLSHAS
ncbi:MAG: DUF2062 domain-containing protein [Acidobacteria bacterium]|nr:DUF2062 domain-containing protein [Acidobacteriota bacterium]